MTTQKYNDVEDSTGKEKLLAEKRILGGVCVDVLKRYKLSTVQIDKAIAKLDEELLLISEGDNHSL